MNPIYLLRHRIKEMRKCFPVKKKGINVKTSKYLSERNDVYFIIIAFKYSKICN